MTSRSTVDSAMTGATAEAEGALGREAVLLRAITTSARDAIILMDPEGRICFWNPAAERMFGYTAEEALGRELHPLLSPERFREAFCRGFARFRESGEGAAIGRTLELTARHKDGREFPIELSLSAVRLADGWHAIGVVRDITERVAAKEAAERSRRFLETLLDAIPHPVMVLDRRWRVVLGNRAALAAAPEGADASAEGLTCHVLSHGRDRPCHLEGEDCPFERVWRTKAPAAVLHEHVDAAGRKRYVQVTAAPIFDEAGEVTQVVEVCQDVTDLKRMEEDLRRSNAELQEFAYVASHDLQEPLRMVSSYVQLLARRYRDALDDDARTFIDFAVDGARRMQVLINDLLQYSRVGTRGKPFEPTDCEALLEEVLANLEVAIRERDAVVTHDPLPTVMADRGQLARVFQNLIGNALKYNKGRPQVHVSAEREGRFWRFAVCDNGIGIPPEAQEKIFAVFHRLHGRSEYDGTGMGLAIAKKIVERHGGRLWVESAPGAGSTFYFTIPEGKDASHGDPNDHPSGSGDTDVGAAG